MRVFLASMTERFLAFEQRGKHLFCNSEPIFGGGGKLGPIRLEWSLCIGLKSLDLILEDMNYSLYFARQQPPKFWVIDKKKFVHQLIKAWIRFCVIRRLFDQIPNLEEGRSIWKSSFFDLFCILTPY